mmetsp:Transcript_69/g.120  ORF Transcript_69/g.120 Transcript_69/m.120 type:complete len:82 (+) Transcript_69:529-774(+)
MRQDVARHACFQKKLWPYAYLLTHATLGSARLALRPEVLLTKMWVQQEMQGTAPKSSCAALTAAVEAVVANTTMGSWMQHT